jgi:periplasmic divalent cation tolerance protein
MQDCKDLDILSVTTTVGSVAAAQTLARSLLERRLAACVQLEPGLQSFYRWEGKACEDPEVRLTIKTAPDRADALQAFFAENHPYTLPQFLAVRMQASPAYAEWVRGELRPAAPAQTPAR